MQKSLWNLCFTVSISLYTENIAKEGYQSMLQNLIRFLKDGRNGWVKQGELFTLSLLLCAPEKYWRLTNNRTKVFCLEFEKLISFISYKAYLKVGFDCKNQTEENEIMCQFKTRYFLNHVV